MCNLERRKQEALQKEQDLHLVLPWNTYIVEERFQQSHSVSLPDLHRLFKTPLSIAVSIVSSYSCKVACSSNFPNNQAGNRVDIYRTITKGIYRECKAVCFSVSHKIESAQYSFRPLVAVETPKWRDPNTVMCRYISFWILASIHSFASHTYLCHSVKKLQ
jgi:hypothetical protein